MEIGIRSLIIIFSLLLQSRASVHAACDEVLVADANPEIESSAKNNGFLTYLETLASLPADILPLAQPKLHTPRVIVEHFTSQYPTTRQVEIFFKVLNEQLTLSGRTPFDHASLLSRTNSISEFWQLFFQTLNGSNSLHLDTLITALHLQHLTIVRFKPRRQLFPTHNERHRFERILSRYSQNPVIQKHAKWLRNSRTNSSIKYNLTGQSGYSQRIVSLKIRDLSYQAFRFDLLSDHFISTQRAIINYLGKITDQKPQLAEAILEHANQLYLEKPEVSPLQLELLPILSNISMEVYWNIAFKEAQAKGRAMVAAILVSIPDPDAIPLHIQDAIESTLRALYDPKVVQGLL